MGIVGGHPLVNGSRVPVPFVPRRGCCTSPVIGEAGNQLVQNGRDEPDLVEFSLAFWIFLLQN
jgi:hypothetical protein